MSEIPKKYKHLEVEDKWGKTWDEWDIYRWDPERGRDETFVVDTPPPTVSGSLHVGHVFSYTHQDLIVRYQRMKGKNIAYPMGWDDNGLPTERRVQNLLGIQCNPHLPYNKDWKPERKKASDRSVEEVSRLNFIEACAGITEEDEKAFEHLWRRMGLSLDWGEQYATIDEHCRRISQLSFLDLMEKGQVYNIESPTMWDIDFKTAVAQAEVEDRPRNGLFHDIRFGVEGGGELLISTTRPELLAACIAVVAHPSDERYQDFFGKYAITPLFGARVPIVPADHAEPEKGTGILMVCTFGDAMDVEWWKKSGIAVKQVIGRNGRLLPVEFGKSPFESVNPAKAEEAWARLAGLTANQGKKVSAELLSEEGSFVDGRTPAMPDEPRSVEQVIKFYEKGDRPLEFVTTRQWFVKILKYKDELKEQGEKIEWHPSYMRSRYQNWVEGLNQDWCISRQRYFGVPFPVWYPVGSDGEPDYSSPIFADSGKLPVDPLSTPAPGYSEEHRDKPGGFSGEPDVMDTWATSSLTPQIQSHWEVNPERHSKLFPMDVRPQSHEIIRTWAFYTIVKAWMHEREIPWRHVVISGWILDPDRKKMSKSKGNVVTPEDLLTEWSSDAVRYWAARARLGADTAFDPSVFKVGRRLAVKVFNASRFVIMQLDRGAVSGGYPDVDSITEPLDLAMAGRMRTVITQATASFESFDYAAALQVSEEAFWNFCDHYLELVKIRSYLDEDTPARRSALAGLAWGLKTFLRLLAPFLPYMTEEVWSWRFSGEGRNRSVHTSQWPAVDEAASVPAPQHKDTFNAAIDVLSEIRATKTQDQKSLRWPVSRLVVTASRDQLEALSPVFDDVLLAGNVSAEVAETVTGNPGEGRKFLVVTELAEENEQGVSGSKP